MPQMQNQQIKPQNTLPDSVWTNNTRIFINMKTEDVLHNYKMYKRYVVHPAFVTERQALQTGMNLCETELRNRNFLFEKESETWKLPPTFYTN